MSKRLALGTALIVALAVSGAVAAADDRRANPVLTQTDNNPPHKGCLARAAQGQVADTHHRHLEPVDERVGGIEAAIAMFDDRRVGDFGDA